jgi:vacuolar-type H+-ATPase subunit I/STV1
MGVDKGAVVAVIHGIGLWIFAMNVRAMQIAGQPPFSGFTGIAWVALAGQVLLAVVAATVVRWRDGQAIA